VAPDARQLKNYAMSTEPASLALPKLADAEARAPSNAPDAADASSPLLPRWLLPIATGVLGVITGVFVSSMVRKPPPVETRFLNFDLASVSRLRSGFSRPESLPDGNSFAWCEAKSCSVTLTSYAAGDRVIAFHADPFRFPDAPQQTVKLWLNGKSLGSKKLVHGAVTRFPAPHAEWKSGENELRFEFGYAEVPKEKTPDNPDDRHLSASFHWLAVAEAAKAAPKKKP
jgi:hypothetical protein